MTLGEAETMTGAELWANATAARQMRARKSRIYLIVIGSRGGERNIRPTMVRAAKRMDKAEPYPTGVERQRVRRRAMAQAPAGMSMSRPMATAKARGEGILFKIRVLDANVKNQKEPAGLVGQPGGHKL